MTEVHQGLPLREWLSLGQAISELHPMTQPEYEFKSWHTGRIRIGKGCKVEANGRTFGPGEYYFEPEQ